MAKLSGETWLQLFVNGFTWIFKPEHIFGYASAFTGSCIGVYKSMTPMEIYLGTLASGALGLFVANQFTQRRWARLSKSQITGAASGEDALPKLPIATPEQLSSSPLSDVRIYLSDLVRGKNRIIKGKTFERCQIIGPALVRPLGVGLMTGCTLRVSVKAEFARDFVWEVPENRWLVGVIGIEDCVWRDCILVDIALVGTNKEIAAWLPGITQRNASQDAISS